MKVARIGLLAAVCAAAALAQTDEDMHLWMEASDKAVLVLKKLEKKTGPEAVSAAERLGAIYENMIGFWRQRNAADAVKWSEQGKLFALELANAAHTHNAEAATTAFQSLNGTCKPCHDAHRLRLPDGKYRIK